MQQPTMQIQQIMQELESDHQRISEKVITYQALKQEVAELKIKAAHDPQAALRMKRIVTHELLPLRQQVEMHIAQAEKKIQHIESLRPLSGNSTLGTKSKPTARLGRRYI
jgi:hypothetical protein